MIILLTISLIILGMTVSYIIARRMSFPVKKLMGDIQKRKGIDFKDTRNEMVVLSRVFNSIANQEDNLTDILEKNKRAVRVKYLTDLLKGNMEKEETDQNSLEFPFKYFTCGVIVIDRYDKFYDKYATEQQYYLKLLIQKTCEEILGCHYKAPCIAYEANKIAVIINMDELKRDETLDVLKGDFKKLQKELEKVLDNTISVGLGNFYEDICDINQSFIEANEAVKYKIISGHGSINIWCEHGGESNRYFYPYHIEKHILNNLKLGMQEETVSAIKELIKEIREKEDLSSDNVIQIFIQMVGNTVKYLVESNINISTIFGNNYNIYQKLSGKETLDEIEQWLLGFYSGIQEYTKMSKTDDISRVNAVLNYIQESYCRDIDITSIADHTKISYSYVRKIVKEKTGKSVVDYINCLRIEEAKRLLRQTSKNTADIATDIGYNNVQSFNRFFKKFEGITPGEYRNFRG
jgi:AraC-like DNA-binding protein